MKVVEYVKLIADVHIDRSINHGEVVIWHYTHRCIDDVVRFRIFVGEVTANIEYVTMYETTGTCCSRWPLENIETLEKLINLLNGNLKVYTVLLI